MISVIIPLYNKEAGVVTALRSVLAQTYQDFEIVVVDDGSTDESVAVVESFDDPRIRLIRQQNAGVSAARNRGIKEAEGEYVAFLDADDEWMPGFLTEIRALQEAYPNCKAQATNYIFNSNGKKSPTILRRIPFKGERGVLSNYFKVASCSHPPVCSISVCIERKLLQEIGGFPIGIKAGEDLLTWARIAVRTQWAYSRKALAQYNVDQISVKEPPTRIPEEVDVVGYELKKLWKDHPHIRGQRLYLSLWHKMRSSMYMRLGYKKECRKEAFIALHYNPLNYKIYAYLIINILGIFKKK
ncbi:MAG: glycosyltransferase family 2 protein [Bacteroidaceae bacterium]|nr:glycosyltransferase family 2 protein [Bacteroidaceae bacterium]